MPALRRGWAAAVIALANASRRSPFALVRHQVLRARPIAGDPVVMPIATQQADAADRLATAGARQLSDRPADASPA